MMFKKLLPIDEGFIQKVLTDVCDDNSPEEKDGAFDLEDGMDGLGDDSDNDFLGARKKPAYPFGTDRAPKKDCQARLFLEEEQPT